MVAFCPEHPKWDQNAKFTPLIETSIPSPFICRVPPAPGLLTCIIKGTLVIKFHHPTCMPDTGNVKDCFELPPTFSIFTLKNVTWRTYFISFTVQYCFLFRFVCKELVSLIWFLQIWVAIYVYGTMINWSTLIKKLMQTYIVIVSGSILNVSTVHLNGILLTPHMKLSIETCIRQTPCIKWTLLHSARVSA